MPTYAIDSTLQQLRATGVIEALPEWREDPTTGRRTPTEHQARDEESGAPLWGVEVTYLSEAWGRLTTTVAKVTVPSPTAPVVTPFEPVPFRGLSVTANATKAGALRETWRAEGIEAPARRGSE